jgi:hypothetical protein
MARKRNHTTSHKISPYENESNSITYWLLIGYAALFLCIAPFSIGLFNGHMLNFDKPIFTALVWNSIFLIVIGLSMFRRWQPRDQRDVLLLLVWLLPLAYTLTHVFAAVSNYRSVSLVYLHVMYASFFMLGLLLAKRKFGAMVLQGAILLSGYVIVWFGFFNWFGNATYKDAVMQDNIGIRLASVFQYSNTYAAFLIGLLLASLVVLVSSRRWYLQAASAIMLVPIVVSFMLTLSRGGLVVLPIVLLAVLPCLLFARQVLVLIYLGVSGVFALFILSGITNHGLAAFQQQSVVALSDGWGVLLLTSVITAVILVGLQRYTSGWFEDKTAPLSSRRVSRLALPLVAVAVCSAAVFLLFNTGVNELLPETIKERVESIHFQQHSVLERGTFYADSIKLFNDYPVFGAGGGAWSALYETIQVGHHSHHIYLVLQ